jgi:hypothetical protein
MSLSPWLSISMLVVEEMPVGFLFMEADSTMPVSSRIGEEVLISLRRESTVSSSSWLRESMLRANDVVLCMVIAAVAFDGLPKTWQPAMRDASSSGWLRPRKPKTNEIPQFAYTRLCFQTMQNLLVG